MDHRPFETGARTVIGVAQQFELLKHEAVRMHDVFGTGERGYFTPTEDDAITHLVVSYYQCRNALFDLIDDLRAGPDRFQLEKPCIFAVGYAAAVLLVDAARFMRDLFDMDPIVAERLDRPEPAFGIPAGLYSATQKSLTDPAHAWDLHRANGHWDLLLPKLRREAERDTRLAEILSIVEKLGDKVRVSKRQYAKARFLFRAREVADTAGGAVSQAIYSTQQVACRLVGVFSTDASHHPALPASVRSQILERLRPGDVLVTRKECALTNYFLPGYWPHAALYLGTPADLESIGVQADHPNVLPRWDSLIGNGTPQRVLEALADGVRLRPIDSAFSVDAISVIRPKLPDAKIAEALMRGLAHEGKAYDFDFDFTHPERLVCTEVIYRTYEGIAPEWDFKLNRRAGRLTLSAEDLLQMASREHLFHVNTVYCPSQSREVVDGDHAINILKKTVIST